MQRLLACAVVAALSGSSSAVLQQAEVALNPIRKVVTLLQAMQKKVEEEGEAEAKLYEKFMCYCKNGAGELEASISAAEDKLASLPEEIKAALGKLEQLKADVKQHQTDKHAAKDAMAEATAIREKEAAAFAAVKTDSETNIAAVKKAIDALGGSSFLQTGVAQTLRRIVVDKADLVERCVDRKLYGNLPRCPQCGLGRVKVRYASLLGHGGQGAFTCPGGYDDDEYVHCGYRAQSAERPPWVETGHEAYTKPPRKSSGKPAAGGTSAAGGTPAEIGRAHV